MKNMILKIFFDVEDPRVVGRCTYPLPDLLAIALLTIICNGETFQDMSDFARLRAKDFGLLEGCDTTPSPDTFERMMAAVDPTEIQRCLIEHGRAFLDSLREKQVVIDGKKLKGAAPKATGNKGIYIMNAFVSENQLTISQLELEGKENEIVAIPKLLDNIDIEGAVVSIDAIGTQVNIAQKILDKGGSYLLAVKDNQKALCEAVADAFRYNKPADTDSTLDAGHGRIETRRCRILDAGAIEDKDVLARWPGVKTLAEITSTVDYGDHVSATTRLYISSEDFPKAAYFNLLARGHWSIENQLHWHLDVTFKEDASRSRKGYASQNLSCIRKLALQVVKNFSDKISLRRKRFLASISPDYMLKILLSAKF